VERISYEKKFAELYNNFLSKMFSTYCTRTKLNFQMYSMLKTKLSGSSLHSNWTDDGPQRCQNWWSI